MIEWPYVQVTNRDPANWAIVTIAAQVLDYRGGSVGEIPLNSGQHYQIAADGDRILVPPAATGSREPLGAPVMFQVPWPGTGSYRIIARIKSVTLVPLDATNAAMAASMLDGLIVQATNHYDPDTGAWSVTTTFGDQILPTRLRAWALAGYVDTRMQLSELSGGCVLVAPGSKRTFTAPQEDWLDPNDRQTGQHVRRYAVSLSLCADQDWLGSVR